MRHKSRKRFAHRLLDAQGGDLLETLSVARDIGFSERQAKRLEVLFPDVVPGAASKLLHTIGEDDRFDVVSAAIDLRERRHEFADRQVKRRQERGTRWLSTPECPPPSPEGLGFR